MDYGFAQRVLQSKQPLIRVIDRYMHEDPENFISFAEGNPGFECMATDKIIEIAQQVMTEDTAEVLLYGENSGNFELKDAIRDRWKRERSDGRDFLCWYDRLRQGLRRQPGRRQS